MKHTGLFWWIDRWRKSTAYTDMTLAEQGAYRNLLDEAHLRGGALPNDERILAKACGDALSWSAVKPAVMAKFELLSDGWHNLTLDGIIAKTALLSEERSKAGVEGNRKRWNKPITNGIANGIANASSPDPDPDPSSVTGSVTEFPVINNKLDRKDGVPIKANGAHAPLPPARPDGRSKRPIFTGQRLTVFEWMLDDCIQTLGPLTDAFDLHEWFFALDKLAANANMVIPKRDGGAWLQSQLLAEAKRRNLPIAVVTDPTKKLGRVEILTQAMADIRREERQR